MDRSVSGVERAYGAVAGVGLSRTFGYYKKFDRGFRAPFFRVLSNNMCAYSMLESLILSKRLTVLQPSGSTPHDVAIRLVRLAKKSEEDADEMLRALGGSVEGPLDLRLMEWCVKEGHVSLDTIDSQSPVLLSIELPDWKAYLNLLFALGADPNDQTPRARESLIHRYLWWGMGMIAAGGNQERFMEVVRYLLEAGADPLLENKVGQSAWSYIHREEDRFGGPLRARWEAVRDLVAAYV